MEHSTEFHVQQREPYADGRRFGGGAYELLRGEIRYHVNPQDWPTIVDLARAPQGGDGRVTFAGDFVLARPVNGARVLLVDVPNRGRPASFGTFNRVPRAEQLAVPTHPGDGFLFDQGLALLSVGWQCDVAPEAGLALRAPRAAGVSGEVISRVQPATASRSLFHGQLGAIMDTPTPAAQADARLYRQADPNAVPELLPRDSWQFARQRSPDAAPQPDTRFLWLNAGFEAGVLYTVVYRAEDPFVVGTGLLAVREAARGLRTDDQLGGHERVLAFGISQTGRLLRHFLSLGLNADASAPAGRVFDGMLIHIAGAQRGDFNHRCAQPGSLGVPSCGQQPPFDLPTAAAPKTVLTNTSWEYWRGDAALAHITHAGEELRDRPLADHERVWLFAGTHHIGPVLPVTTEMPELGLRTAATMNIVDAGPLLRAALVNLVRWVADGQAPPASSMPCIADGSAVSRAALLAAWRDWPQLAPDKLTAVHTLDLGAEGAAGVPHYPAVPGTAWPALVAALDADGNERAGIRLPDISVPVGVHSGWNPRHPDCGAGDQAAVFAGFSLLFPAAELRARYADRDHYAALVQGQAQQLVDAGYLLATDLQLVVDNCLRRFDLAMDSS